jgi:hypothetical protein
MQPSLASNRHQIKEITYSARFYHVSSAGSNGTGWPEHRKSVDKVRRICYQFTCVREDYRGTTWSIPDVGMVTVLQQGMYLRADGSFFKARND